MDTKKRLIAVVIVAASLGGCALRPPVGNLCTAGPIILDPDDVLVERTEAQIVVLNESGEAICGWKPLS